MSVALRSRLGVETERCTQIRDIFEDGIGKRFEGKKGPWLVLRFWLGLAENWRLYLTESQSAG